MVGVLAERVAVCAQTVCVDPVNAVVGMASRIISMVAVEAGHTPLITLHSKVFVPVPRPVIWVEGFETETTVPAPLTKDQEPTPNVGVVADNVAVEIQSV